jgi:peptidyl-prolyl cis-trans isomerase A (cyclophilin A)
MSEKDDMGANNLVETAQDDSSSVSRHKLSMLQKGRRAFVRTASTVFAGATSSTFLWPFLRNRRVSRKSLFIASAIEATENATPGNVVELTVSNIAGDPSQSGSIQIQLYPSWAPIGVQRFEDLIDNGFYNNCRFFRVIPGFIVQTGINGNPAVMSQWRTKNIPDDPVKVSNAKGTVVFATAGPNSRTTQFFINTNPDGNGFLDKQGFAPIGKVISGMDLVYQLYGGYGEGAPSGKGPNQARIQLQGNSYLENEYPKLSYIASTRYIEQ